MRVLIAFIVMVMGSVAFADGVIRPALSYSIQKEEQGTSSSEVTRRMIDLSGGWVGSSGFSVLGLYGTENKVTSSGGSSTTSDRTSLGLGIGYTSRGEGPFAAAYYFLSNKEATGGTNYEGDGMQFDLGYLFKMSAVGIGLQLSYRMHNYKKINGATLPNPRKVTNLDPMFALQFNF